MPRGLVFLSFSKCKNTWYCRGLPILMAITEARGGTISVIRHDGKGSVFSVRMPVPTHQTIPG